MAKIVKTLHVRHQVLQKFGSGEPIPAYEIQVCYSDGTCVGGWVFEEAFDIKNLNKIVEMLTCLTTK